MRKRNKALKNVLSIGLICTLSIIGSSKISNANESAESQLNSVIQSYGDSKVDVEDGISLHIGETEDFSKNPNWKLSNDNVVSIDEKGQLKAIGSGTVFLSQKIGDKVHIIEVYVPSMKQKSSRLFSAKVTPKRDYYKVFVDAGHGGIDSGANGFGKNEAQLNLEVAKKVEQKLKEKNIQVEMSRETNEFVELGERARLANNYGADVFVSIHQNSADAESANGIETYCHPDKKVYSPLALEIQNNAIAQTGARNREVKYSNLAVLRESNMPSALFESGFISNKTEYNKLIDPSYQDKLATGIADGVEKYLKNTVDLGYLPVISTGVVVNTDEVNVRAGYGTSYAIIGKLPKGSKVEIVESKNNWYKIKYNGVYGYVSGSYISIDKQISLIDIDGHWAKNQILDFVSKGYVAGYEDNTFRPENSITRAEFVKLVNKVFKFTETGSENFSDVNSSQWYYSDICIGLKAGYINGYEDGTFRPENPITREEACKTIAKVMNLRGDGNLTFKDSNQISDWAKEYVDALSDNKIINGYEDNTFRPNNNMTRAETVTILSRVEK
ncbi:N-acetylmuramoyl-L-alanine amidase [Paraclostridium ghonii]|uniref:N-acetylmuramoyl-L-alanine amidase n=1 Tax=Paraclostridium ghonii TaxID=29358 RepID=UPI002545FBF7|nr:N-acetylmuramoyl-L-alanine amidase [Paeniclostridium ghonii]